MPLPRASLSLDLDNLWSYLKTHGDAGWDEYPSYLDIVIPRVLRFLEDRKLKITWFIVGKDAADPRHHGVLRSIADAGHEIGNHSFHHEPWLHLYSEEDIHKELATTEQALREATGQHPIGFRGPGFSHSPTLLRVLAARGYRYDASTFPTFLGPLARMYYFATARGLSYEEKEKRKQLFGKLDEGFRPLQPYTWRDAGDLLEIPVTTLPIFRVPFHLSYLLYLGTFSKTLAKAYWRSALVLSRATGTEISFLLHPLDFLGKDDTDRLSFFPAMNRPAAEKVALAGDLIDMFQEMYSILPMHEHAEAILAKSGQSVRRLAMA